MPLQRRCPRCSAHYLPPARFCPRDGTPLVELEVDGPPIPMTGQILDQRYEIRATLAQGALSLVYDAWDREAEERVVIKTPAPRVARDPAAVERLRREARLLATLRHPNVCPLRDARPLGRGSYYLVMPYLDGESLLARRTALGRLAAAALVPVLRMICDGLEAAHRLGAVHRDLKPEHILLVTDGEGERAVLIDFGVARQWAAEPGRQRLTLSGHVMGTPEFMSPEQVRGDPLDARSDLYALGVVAYEALAGRLPFAARDPHTQMLARLGQAPEPLEAVAPEVPPAVGAVVMRALARDPAARWPSAGAMREALAAALP